MRGWFLPVLTVCACSEYAFEGEKAEVAAPEIEVDPLALDFGVVAQADRPELHVTITNVGDALLELGTLTIEGSGSFTLATAASGAQLAPGESADATVTYAPATTPISGEDQDVWFAEIDWAAQTVTP